MKPQFDAQLNLQANGSIILNAALKCATPSPPLSTVAAAAVAAPHYMLFRAQCHAQRAQCPRL